MTARDDNPELHRIEVGRDADGEAINVRFICDGDADAPCHQWPDCGCETWGEGYHYADEYDPADPHKKRTPMPGHEDVPQEMCWMDPWFNDTTGGNPGEFIDLYDGDVEGHMVPHPDGGTYDDHSWLVSGPVSCTFEGDYMTWEYAS